MTGFNSNNMSPAGNEQATPISSEGPVRCLPVDFIVNSEATTVKWLDFGYKPLSEPFFNHTVKRLQSLTPMVKQYQTTVSEFLDIGRIVPSTEPAGIIFHVSRCGSTLLANALKAGKSCIALSEAQPVDVLFRTASRKTTNGSDSNINREMLQTLISLYSAVFDASVIIKCHTTSILEIARMRSIWPVTPFIILTRNPVEVMVSNLEKRSDWIKGFFSPSSPAKIEAEWLYQTQQLNAEECCARGLGLFFERAKEQMDNNCWVVDYEDLNVETIVSAADIFKISLPDPTSNAFQGILKTYSKDPSAKLPFQKDGKQKQNIASPYLQELAGQWAQEPYDLLLANARATGNLLRQ